MQHNDLTATLPPPASLLNSLLGLSDLPKHYPALFASEPSARWFIRQHRRALEQDGALLFLRGRLQVVPEKFEQAALRIGAEAAKRRLAA